MCSLMKTVLFVDGRNFLGKLEDIFKSEGVAPPSWHTYNFRGLLDLVSRGIKIDERIFYFAKIKEHPETKEKSRELIEGRRLLKARLERHGFCVVLSGAVRGHYTTDPKGREVLIFREKGVDVSIAVDMVVAACDGKLHTAIIASSDSDLQPAIRELRKRNIEAIYVGFEIMPNKGLTATTKRTILIRNSEALQFKEGLL